MRSKGEGSQPNILGQRELKWFRKETKNTKKELLCPPKACRLLLLKETNPTNNMYTDFKRMTKVEIQTQVFEWYGSDEEESHIGDPLHGRYKPKGSQNFIIEVEEGMFYDHQDKITKAFDAKYGHGFFKYTIIDMNIYYEPDLIQLDLD